MSIEINTNITLGKTRNLHPILQKKILLFDKDHHTGFLPKRSYLYPKA